MPVRPAKTLVLALWWAALCCAFVAGRAAAADGATTITAVNVKGARGGEQPKVEEVIATMAGVGVPFVESGPADQIGTPIGTAPRLRQLLDDIGYNAVVETQPAPGGVALLVNLRPYDRVRYIFVRNNGRLRQDEIQRRITFRPGRPLPLPGPERDAALERERARVIDYLRGEGFFDANVRIDLDPQRDPEGAIDVTLTVGRGSAYPIGPLTVVGNTAIPAAQLAEMFRHRDWHCAWACPSPFTSKQLRLDIDALVKRYRALGYVGARVTSDFNPQTSLDRQAKQVRLVINVAERKRIAVAFEGNREKSSGTLKDQLTLFERGSYDDFEVTASADALQRYYQKEGHLFARVAWRREHLSPDEDRLVFTIDEGPELKVRGIDFVGTKAITAEELREVVSVRPFPVLGYVGLGEGGYVTGRQLEQDAERIVDHYRSRGFPDATARGEAATAREALGLVGAVAAAAETVSRDARTIYVRFTIDEGPQVVLAEETFRTEDGSPLPYGDAFLRESLTMRPGDPYRTGLVREDARRLERLMADAGYIAAVIEPEVTRDQNKIRLSWLLKLGTRTRVGPTFVRGNFVTRSETILEQIPLQTGDLITTTAVERGQRNLSFMQLFNNAEAISFPGREEKRPSVPMVVQVEERYEQFNVIRLGVGASTEQAPPDSAIPIGAFGKVTYENRNLLGRGWTFAGGVAKGQSLLRANVIFLDRRFFGTLFRFDAALSYFSQETVRLGDLRSGGGSIGFSREMYPGIDAGIHYNLRNTTHTESLIRGAGPSEFDRTVRLGTTVGSLSFNVEWQRLDNRLAPSRGFKLEATAEIALPALSAPLRPLPFPVGDDTFLKVALRSTSVIPLTRWLSLRHGARFENGFPLGGPALLPKVERYFAGGDTTIRGFRLDRARVEVVQYPLSPLPGGGGLYGVEYHPIGGNLRIIQNIDLQFPISVPWYGSIFMDNGVVADSLDGLTAGQFRHGVGIAPLLLKLPIGDLSFAWAWPLDPGPGDTKIGVFHVNIGLMF